MDQATLLFDLLTGGVLGLLGQGIRVVVGLRKQQAAPTEPFDASRLGASLLIGFVAGALGVLALGLKGVAGGLESRAVAELLATGYAGTDFIEGFVRQYLPKPGPGDRQAVPPPAVAAP